MRANLSANDIFHPGTSRIKQIDASLLSSEDSCDEVLDFIEKQFPQSKVTTLLKIAKGMNCLSHSDVQVILGKAIQFISIADDHFHPLLKQDLIGLHYDNLSTRLLEVLLFAAELHNPAVDRLRMARRRYDISRSSLGIDGRARSGKGAIYDLSPAPLVPPMVEKLFYNSERSWQETEALLNTLPFTYWMFSATIQPRKGLDHWFLAFDGNYDYIPRSELLKNILTNKKSQTILQGIVEKNKRWNLKMTQDEESEVLNYIMDELYCFCGRYSLSMVGTPFFNPPAKMVHILPKRIVVDAEGEYVNVHIPRFYIGNHLETMRAEDFSDLDMIMGREKEPRVSNKVRKELPKRVQDLITLKEACGLHLAKPRPNDNPISEDEIKWAAHFVWHVMHTIKQYSAYGAFEYICRVVHPWWRGEETLERKLRAYLPKDDTDTIKLQLKSIDQILTIMNDVCIQGHESITGNDKYYWARFCREREKAANNQDKVRNVRKFKGPKKFRTKRKSRK